MIWNSKHLWPDDTAEALFLLRAVDALGEAKYGPLWTGIEPFAETWAAPVAWETQAFDGFGKTGWNRVRVSRLITRHRPDHKLSVAERDELAGRRRASGGTMSLSQWMGNALPGAFSRDDWALAGQLADIENAASSRWLETTLALKREMAGGKLKCFGRRVSGAAALVALTPAIWNMEGPALNARFLTAAVDWDQPDRALWSETTLSDHRVFYLFVGKAELQGFVTLTGKSDDISVATNDKVTAFAEDLVAQITLSPKEKKMTRLQAKAYGAEKYGLHPEGFERGWTLAMIKAPRGHLWGSPGRPKKALK